VSAPYISYDILVVLGDVALSKEKITDNMLVILDKSNAKGAEKIIAKTVDIPFKDIVKELNANEIVKNSIAIGSLMKILKIDFSTLEDILRETYPSEKLFKINLEGAKKGFDATESSVLPLETSEDLKEHIVLTGNEAICLGAIAAGSNFCHIPNDTSFIYLTFSG